MKFPRAKNMLSVVCLCAAGTLAGPASAGLGQDFGTRDPIACPVRNAPRTGAPSLPQVIRYFACDVERIGDTGENIYLVSDVDLQVTPKGRPYNAKTDSAEGADPDQPVYEIHGSFRLYQCGRKSSVSWQSNPGHACRYEAFYDAQGLCWKDARADWHCGMKYQFDIQHSVHDAAPPP